MLKVDLQSREGVDDSGVSHFTDVAVPLLSFIVLLIELVLLLFSFLVGSFLLVELDAAIVALIAFSGAANEMN